MTSHEALRIFNDIYEDTYNDVVEYVLFNCSNINDVEDITQNVYCDVYKIIKKKKGEISKSYILGIANNKIKDYYRIRYKQKEISFIEDENDKDYINNIPSEEDIESEIIKTDNINIIWEFLKTKRVVISQIFYLYYKLDYPIKKVAQKLNLSESSTKHYIYRTLKDLNKYIESEGNRNG